MIMLNTMDCSTKKIVSATIVMKVELVVGGVDDADRIDSVDELIKDHYEDIAPTDFFGEDGVKSITIASIDEANNN